MATNNCYGKSRKCTMYGCGRSEGWKRCGRCKSRLPPFSECFRISVLPLILLNVALNHFTSVFNAIIQPKRNSQGTCGISVSEIQIRNTEWRLQKCVRLNGNEMDLLHFFFFPPPGFLLQSFHFHS